MKIKREPPRCLLPSKSKRINREKSSLRKRKNLRKLTVISTRRRKIRLPRY